MQVGYFVGLCVSLLASDAFDYKWISLTQCCTLFVLLIAICIKLHSTFMESTTIQECFATYSTSTSYGKRKKRNLAYVGRKEANSKAKLFSAICMGTTIAAVIVSILSSVAQLSAGDVYGIYASGSRASIPLLSCGISFLARRTISILSGSLCVIMEALVHSMSQFLILLHTALWCTCCLNAKWEAGELRNCLPKASLTVGLEHINYWHRVSDRNRAPFLSVLVNFAKR